MMGLPIDVFGRSSSLCGAPDLPVQHQSPSGPSDLPASFFILLFLLSKITLMRNMGGRS